MELIHPHVNFLIFNLSILGLCGFQLLRIICCQNVSHSSYTLLEEKKIRRNQLVVCTGLHATSKYGVW